MTRWLPIFVSKISLDSTEKIYNKFELPQCDDCGGKPLDDKYTELGDDLAKMPLFVALTMGAAVASVKTSAVIETLSRILKLAGYEEKGKELKKMRTAHAVGEYIDENFRKDVKWKEQNGRLICYQCKQK